MDEAGEWKPIALREVIAWAEERRRLSESQRLFYVAATRARDYLALSAPEGEKGKDGTWMALLKAAFPDWESPFGEGGEFRMKVVREAEWPKSVRPLKSAFSRLKEEAPVEAPSFLRLLEPIPQSPPSHFTVTDLLQYRMCPRAFYYETYLGLKEAQTRPQGEAPSAGEGPRGREVGDWVHLYLERWKGGPFEEIRGIPHPEEGEARDEALRLLQHFRGTDMAREIETEKTRAEVPFLLERDGVLIRGRIDRLLWEKDGRLRVLDFKTDRAQGADEIARLARRYEFQVGVYALALKEIGLSPSAVLIHFLRPGVTHRFEVDDGFVDRISHELDEALRGIREGDFHPDTQNCPACLFPTLCSHLTIEHPRTSAVG
jgi:ATP-dependent exoDNAse (exonuclease V) beta subunit